MRTENPKGPQGGMEARTEVKKGYLKVILEGEFSIPDAMKIASRVFDFCHQHKIRNVLLDARKVTGKPSLVTKIEFADTMVEKQMEYIVKGSPRLRIAHLLDPGMAEPVKFGEMLAAKRGAIIFVTHTLDEALRWLGVEEGTTR